MNLVDVVLLVVVAVAAIEGLRLGAVLQVLTFGGFWLGMYLGALLASVTGHWAHSQAIRSIVAVGTVLVTAIVLGVAGRVIGARLFRRVHRGRMGSLDSALGVVVAVCASLLAVWLLASTLVSSSSLQFNAALSNSRILRSMDRVLPPPPSVFSRLQGFLSSEGFPPVFAGLVPASAGPVALPTPAAVDAAVHSAALSTVKIVGVGCNQIQEGSGFIVAPGLVVTNAHVVAGIPAPMVEDGAGRHRTTVVLFDPSYDLAVLRVDGLDEPALALDPGAVPRGTGAAVLGYPGGGSFTYGGAGVMAEFEAEGRDIYGQGLTLREVYELQAVVRPGNSGGPLVLPDGRVAGVVFSRSTTDPDVGYALTSPGVLQRVESVLTSTTPVGTGPCTDD